MPGQKWRPGAIFKNNLNKKMCLPDSYNVVHNNRMEARRHKRMIVSLPAEITTGDTRFAGSIENLSDEGLYLVTAPSKASLNFKSNVPVELSITFPSGEKINLTCRVKWSYQTPPHGYTNSLGLEILEKSPEYKEALITLM